MATHVPCKKNDSSGYVFYVSLVSQSNVKIFQANPTYAAGDIKVAVDDAGPANVSAVAVDGDFTKRVKITLSQAQTNGDNLTVICSDAAGSEWCDLTINIQTSAQTLDEIDVNVDDIETDTNELQGLISASKIAAQVKGIDDIDFSATMKTSLESAVDDGLDNAIGGSPTADSVAQRVKAVDLLTESSGSGDLAAILTDTSATLDGKITTVDTVVDGIQTDLSNVDDGLGALKTLIEAVPTASEIQTEMEADGSSLLDTIRDELANGDDGLSALKSLIDAIQTQVDTTGVALLASAVDDIWDEVLTGASHNDATSAGRRLRAAGHDTTIARENTCQAGEDASHVKLDSSASGTDAFYDHMWIYLESGTGAGQVRLMDDYVGSSKVAEIHPDWLTSPDGATEFAIIARAQVFTHDINAEGLASINAEVVDVVGTDTLSELSQAAPSATPTIKSALMLIYMSLRNKLTVTSSEMGVYNDSGTKIAKKVLSDNGSTYTEDEMASGA